MKKVFLGAFIFVDLAVIGGSGFVLYSVISRRMTMHSLNPAAFSGINAAPSNNTSATPASTAKPAAGGIQAPAAAADTSARKILFSYRSPHSRQVSIRADFTGWKAEPMQKAGNGSWTYTASLTPGEYAYCYTADDKTFKDPANKRTKQIGRTLVSAIVVQALPSKTAK